MQRSPLYFSFCITTFVVIGALFLTQVHATAVTIGTEQTAMSVQVSALPSVDTTNGTSGRSGVRFSGLAYPKATVFLLQDAFHTMETTADNEGRFSFVFTDTRDLPSLFFALFAVDSFERRSTLLNFPVSLYAGVLTDIANIRFAPTIQTDKVSVAQNDFITIEGAALPNKIIELLFEGPQTKLFTLSANTQGLYSLSVPLSLATGDYLLRARYQNDTRTSSVLRIVVGDASILRAEISDNIPGDCNLDQKVTLVDFSVLAYWFGKKNPPDCVDVNKDGIINLTDFSIVAYYWTG